MNIWRDNIANCILTLIGIKQIVFNWNVRSLKNEMGGLIGEKRAIKITYFFFALELCCRALKHCVETNLYRHFFSKLFLIIMEACLKKIKSSKIEKWPFWSRCYTPIKNDSIIWIYYVAFSLKYNNNLFEQKKNR